MTAVRSIEGTTCLVTGAAGFVGARLAATLVARGATVRGLDAAALPSTDARIAPFQGDLCDPSFVQRALEGVDVVFHTAALIELAERAPESVRARVRAVNVDATAALLVAAEEAGVSRFVHVSSTATVLEPGAAGGDESLPYSTSRDLYTTTKVAAEKLVRSHRGAMQTVSLRPGGIYGPGERKQLVGPSFAAFAKGEPLTILGDGTSRLDYTHVDNLVDALLRAAERLQPGSPLCSAAYFVSDEQPINHGEFTRRLLAGLGMHPRVRHLPIVVVEKLALVSEHAFERFGKKPLVTRMQVRTCSMDYFYDTGAARRDLGYVPLHDTDAGIRTMVPDVHAYLASSGFRGR